MKTLALLSLILLTTPAQAHCFSRWYYPHPQKCWAGRAAAPKIYRVSQAEAAPAMKSQAQKLDWGPPADIPDIPIDPFAPISPAAHPSEEDDRTAAFAKLKTELSGH